MPRTQNVLAGFSWLMVFLFGTGCTPEADNLLHLKVQNIPTKADRLDTTVLFDNKIANKGVPSIDLANLRHFNMSDYSVLITYEIPLDWFGLITIDLFAVDSNIRTSNCVLAIGTARIKVNREPYKELICTGVRGECTETIEYRISKEKVDYFGNHIDYENPLRLVSNPVLCQ